MFCHYSSKVVKGEVIDKSEVTKMIKLKTTIINQDEKSLIEGIAQILIR